MHIGEMATKDGGIAAFLLKECCLCMESSLILVLDNL